MIQPSLTFKLAASQTEIRAYFSLRQQIFCVEQALFIGSDRDPIDDQAYPIIAVDPEAETPGQVVGIVRIYETEVGHWYGGRLGVHREYRRRGQIGKGLIRKAVTTAQGWGCERFLATVQVQNVRFFQRLHWHSLQEITVMGHPHHLMQADLDDYPPDPIPRIHWQSELAEVS